MGRGELQYLRILLDTEFVVQQPIQAQWHNLRSLQLEGLTFSHFATCLQKASCHQLQDLWFMRNDIRSLCLREETTYQEVFLPLTHFTALEELRLDLEFSLVSERCIITICNSLPKIRKFALSCMEECYSQR